MFGVTTGEGKNNHPNRDDIENLEERINVLENRICDLEGRVLTWGSFFWMTIIAVILLRYGNAIWNGIKFIGATLIGFPFYLYSVITGKQEPSIWLYLFGGACFLWALISEAIRYIRKKK
jgi:hypothetical protein